MPFELIIADSTGPIEALAHAIAQAKQGDRLRPVTVVVPTNVAGVMARRALGRTNGVIGVDMVTLNRLAELLGGPVLAAAKRQPVSTPILELTVRKVLAEAPGSYRPVADHPSTVTALRELHQELRLARADEVERLTETSRGREVVRVSRAVTRILRSRWYDEGDLLAVATEQLAKSVPESLRTVILYLPGRLDGSSAVFVRRLAEVGGVVIVTSLTHDPDDDDPVAEHADGVERTVLESLAVSTRGATRITSATASASTHSTKIVATTDADDEVRLAVRHVVDAARGAVTGAPVAFERIAVLWPSHRPYARLVEHHLGADGIDWNGRGGTELSERIAPRLLLDLLDVDRGGLKRRALFELLADIPSRDAEGRPRQTAQWERVSRVAGVSDDKDWTPRLAALKHRDNWAPAAESLSAFVTDLRATLGRPTDLRTWREWVDWCVEQLESWLGRQAVARFSDPEYRAWEALMSALERLRYLDEVGEPVARSEFRSVLASELESSGVREGRIGTGVTVGSLASAAGLDVDVVVVLGANDGSLPPAPDGNPLLSDSDRERAGLATSDHRARQLHHSFLSVTSSASTLVTWPRGDLRANTVNQPSRWLTALGTADVVEIDSSVAGLTDLAFAPCERERRLGDLLVERRAGRPLTADHDPVLAPRLSMRSGRGAHEVTVYDGDLTEVAIPAFGTEAISPTQIAWWTSCPHGYFMRYLLRVHPVDEPDGQISINALDRGTAQHDTLDAFHHDVINGVLSQPTETGWTSEHREALLGHFDAVCDRFERTGRTGRPATWAGQKVQMRADLLGWLDSDSAIAAAHGARVLESEHGFPTIPDPSTAAASATAFDRVAVPLPGGRSLAVKGSIDRLDRWSDGTLVVTDHKTGKADSYKKLAPDDPTLGGTVFQLPTYAAAAIARFADDDAAPTVRTEYSMFKKGGYQRFGFEMTTDIWGRVAHDLGEIVDGIETGWFPQVPVRPGYHFFVACHYCEPDELGTLPQWERWQAKRADERIARWFAEPDPEPDDRSEGSDDV